jgi:hypothetical protein
MGSHQHVQQVLQQFSCSNKTIRNAPKNEFWVKWSGSGALVVKMAPVQPVFHRLLGSNEIF